MDEDPESESSLFTPSELIRALCVYRTTPDSLKVEIVKALKELQRWRNGEMPASPKDEKKSNGPIT
jgi:hypothetical protein